jgi:hypothetical protein
VRVNPQFVERSGVNNFAFSSPIGISDFVNRQEHRAGPDDHVPVRQLFVMTDGCETYPNKEQPRAKGTDRSQYGFCNLGVAAQQP